MWNGLVNISLVSLSVMGSNKELSLLQFFSQSILMKCLSAISMVCSWAILEMLLLMIFFFGSRSVLQAMVNICQDFVSSNNLKFSIHEDPDKYKTKCLVFSKKAKEMKNVLEW